MYINPIKKTKVELEREFLRLQLKYNQLESENRKLKVVASNFYEVKRLLK